MILEKSLWNDHRLTMIGVSVPWLEIWSFRQEPWGIFFMRFSTGKCDLTTIERQGWLIWLTRDCEKNWIFSDHMWGFEQQFKNLWGAKIQASLQPLSIPLIHGSSPLEKRCDFDWSHTLPV